MTNFLIKNNIYVSKIARETDLDIKIAKNYTDIFAQGDANSVTRSIKSKYCFVYIRSLFNLCNE